MIEKITSIARYLLLKIMKKLRQPDDERPAIAAAEHLLDKLLPSAFATFQDAQFREIANFDKLSVAEHDRIFNELEVAAVSACLFCLDRRTYPIGFKDFHFWKEVCEKIPLSFEEKLLRYGANNENAQLFRELIKIRHEEYENISEKNIEWMEVELKDGESEYAKELMAYVQAIAVGTADHIRRGELKAGDELVRYLRRWLFALNIEVVKFIEKL
ncbi:MAG: hypothetical protein UT50_C0013G0002 [Candidatus Moranbacteria bacterium GW2011_GWA2_39_41]|nr:MAG: hypothetical protein UT50_C0013G0002 [Candidatus Moranbacteria bacterium GW2011_GWA2_39_41]